MDWIINNIGGVIMFVTFVYVAIMMILNYLGKFLRHLEYKKVHNGRT